MKDSPPDLDEMVASVAPEGSSLWGFMVEAVTASELHGYRDGQLSWSVARDPDKGPGLVVQETPPEPFDEIRRRLEAEQAAADTERVDFLFDLPLELAASLSGYRPGQGGLEWQILGPKKKATEQKAGAPRRRSLSAA